MDNGYIGASLGWKVKQLIESLDQWFTHYMVKLPQGWRDREAIVRWDSIVLWQTDGGEDCELDLFEVAEQSLWIEYGGDWETAEEQEDDDLEILVNFRRLQKIKDDYRRSWRMLVIAYKDDPIPAPAVSGHRGPL